MLLEHLESACTKIMMRGLLYASYDERNLVYASYDERTYCMPVMMRGPIVCQL